MGLYPAVMTDLGIEFCESQPPMLRGDPYNQAIQHAYAVEIERLRAAREAVRRNLIPATADALGLPWWETLLRLTVDPVGLTVDDRRGRVIGKLVKMLGEALGASWEAAILQLFGSTVTYRDYDPGDDTGPPPATVRVVLPFVPGSALAQQAERLLRDTLVPAHLDIETTYSAGFILDESQLDQQTLDP